MKDDLGNLSRLKDMLTTVGRGLHFTKIDLNQAYLLHIPVTEKSQELILEKKLL